MLEIDDSFQKKYKYIAKPEITEKAKEPAECWFKADKKITDGYDFYERIEDETDGIIKASDNQEYNLKELFITRLSVIFENLILYGEKNQSDTEKFFEEIKEKFKIGISEKELLNITNETCAFVYNSQNLQEVFACVTGKECSRENIEKFLKGEIPLLLEKEYEITTGKQADKISNPPFIKSNYGQGAVQTRKRTTLNDSEKTMYAKLYNVLDKTSQEKLDKCLSSGKLLQNSENKETTVLNSFYKILTMPRAKETDNITILKECINILDNPFVITQITEDIPENFIDKAAEVVYEHENASKNNKKEKEIENSRIKNELEQRGVGTCVAASIEFMLASKFPAEFFSIVEEITSQKKETDKYVNFKKSNLSDDIIESFSTEYKIINGCMKVYLKPDNGAYFLAEMQKYNQENDERTTVDILMQSLITQIAVKNTYNSISDKHSAMFGNETGLNDEEGKYVIQLLTDRDVQNFDFADADNQYKESILDRAIKESKYIIAGLIDKDIDAEEGHEITITGTTKGIDGTEYYICKDTGIEFARPVLIKKTYILEHILCGKIID